MEFFLTLGAIHFIFLGAIYGRLDGGGIAKTREIVERTLVMFFFVLACAPFAGHWALVAYLGVIGIAVGHGQYFLHRQLVGHKNDTEGVDFIVKWAFGKDWRTNMDVGHKFTAEEEKYYYENKYKKLYWRNVFGMFVTGSLVGLPALALAAYFGEYATAAIFSLTGFAKAFAYIVGFEIKRSLEISTY
jgi:hypothetical protein